MTMHELAPLPEPRVPSWERILVAVDGGSGSRAALRWLTGHLGGSKAQVLIVCVTPEGTAAEDSDAELRAAALVLRTMLEHSEIATQLRRGSAVDQLANAADEFDADLIVVGSHSSPQHPRSGRVTVAGRLAARAACTVVVVPAHWTSAPGPIVVGGSIDSASDSAADFAYRLAERSGSTLIVTHVWELPTVGEIEVTPGGGESIPERQKAALDVVVRELAARGNVNVRADLRRGSAPDGLTAAAAGASLLVVGRRARSAAARLILGSTSRALVTAPPCAVAVVPGPAAGLHVSPDVPAEDL